MQKLINVLAVASAAVSIAVVGTVGYVFVNREAIEDVDALILITEWREFRQPDFSRLKKSLRDRVIFDGRNIYDPRVCIDNGLAYIGIGRSSALFQ